MRREARRDEKRGGKEIRGYGIGWKRRSEREKTGQGRRIKV